jgi:hypothetical protein
MSQNLISSSIGYSLLVCSELLMNLEVNQAVMGWVSFSAKQYPNFCAGVKSKRVSKA